MIIQLTDETGEHIGLYHTKRQDIVGAQKDIEWAFTHKEGDRYTIDTWLREYNKIRRIFAKEVVVRSL